MGGMSDMEWWGEYGGCGTSSDSTLSSWQPVITAPVVFRTELSALSNSRNFATLHRDDKNVLSDSSAMLTDIMPMISCFFFFFNWRISRESTASRLAVVVLKQWSVSFFSFSTIAITRNKWRPRTVPDYWEWRRQFIWYRAQCISINLSSYNISREKFYIHFF